MIRYEDVSISRRQGVAAHKYLVAKLFDVLTVQNYKSIHVLSSYLLSLLASDVRRALFCDVPIPVMHALL